MYTWNFNYSLNIYLYVYTIFKQSSLKLLSKIQDRSDRYFKKQHINLYIFQKLKRKKNSLTTERIP